MGYSAGFSPHPKISYVGAAPTGVASEAEYVEIGLAQRRDVEEIRAMIDAALPDGLDIVEAVESSGGSLAERMEASQWEITLAGVDEDAARAAVEALMATTELIVERVTKTGKKNVDVRGALLAAEVRSAPNEPTGLERAILGLVVRQETPAVRPDDVLAALRVVAGLALSGPQLAVRLAQGPIDDSGTIGDPFAIDRAERQISS